MSFFDKYILDPEKFKSQLALVFQDLSDEIPVMFHTDLLRIGAIGLIKNSQQILKNSQRILNEHLTYILEATKSHQQILFPTFNYDFSKTKIFDVLNDPCQVGSLNELVRKKNPSLRTRTPIFNFLILNNRNFNFLCSQNVFGEDSVFGHLDRFHGTILFYGALFTSDTFVHYIEEQANVPYRYLKKFHGQVIRSSEKEDVEILFRVRPQGINLQYDSQKILNILKREAILKSFPLGNGTCIRYDAFRATQLLKNILSRNPTFLLTTKSSEEVLRILEAIKGPMTFEIMEKAPDSNYLQKEDN